MTSQAVEAYKTSKPSAAFAKLDPTESLAEGIGQSYGVIGYKGKIWSLRVRGETHLFLRKDDGTPISYIDVVILRQAKNKAKSFYPGGYEENASAGKRPTCASLDGVKPDPDVLEQQSPTCGLCKKNEWYVDQNGRKKRDCQDYKRLAVLLTPNQTTGFFGAPLMEPVFLRVPPASLNALATFGENLSQQGWPYPSFITRVSFDPIKSHPEFTFKFITGLKDDEANAVMAIREDMIAHRITGEDEIARRATQQLAPSQKTAPIPPALPTMAPSVSHPLPTQQKPEVEDLGNPVGWGGPATSEPKVVEPKVIDATPGVGGSWNIPQEPNPNPVQGADIGQTAEDVGEAVEDPDLDAKINALLAT